MRFSTALIAATVLTTSALAAPLPFASSDGAAIAATIFLTTRSVATPLADEAASMLGSTAKAIVKTVQSDTAANKLATQGLRFTSGASLTSLLADAEKGSKSANNALKAAVKEAPDHMVFDTADPSEKVRQLVYNKYKTGGEITAPKVSTSSKLWKGFLGMFNSNGAASAAAR